MPQSPVFMALNMSVTLFPKIKFSRKFQNLHYHLYHDILLSTNLIHNLLNTLSLTRRHNKCVITKIFALGKEVAAIRASCKSFDCILRKMSKKNFISTSNNTNLNLVCFGVARVFTEM